MIWKEMLAVFYRYRYAFVHGEQIIATGYLTQETMLEVGARVVVDGILGVVRAIEGTGAEHEFRLLVEIS